MQGAGPHASHGSAQPSGAIPAEIVTWDVDHAVLDVCNYSLLTCNYSRNRYLSTGLL